MKTLYFIFFIFCTSFAMAQVQNSSISPMNNAGMRIGIIGGIHAAMFSGDFREFPGTENCCTGFGSASGTDLFGGAELQFLLSPSLFFRAGLHYSRSSALFTADEFIGNALQKQGNNFVVVDAISRHTTQPAISALDIMPAIAWYPLKNIPLSVSGGLRLMIPLSATHQGKEELITPQDATFSDTRSTVRNPQNGDLTTNTFLFGLTGGIRYDIQLSPSITLSPDITYSQMLSDPIDFSSSVTKGQSLSLGFLRAGIVLAWTGKSEDAPEDKSDEKSVNVSVIAREIRNGNEYDIARLVVDETHSTQLYPLLPYIFFEQGTDRIPEKYFNLRSDQIAGFDPDKEFTFMNDPANGTATVNMRVYYHLLNIVGRRMNQYKDATLTITGCNNGYGSEKNNTQLAQKRADAIKAYLANIWGIDPARLKTENRNLPQAPTSQESESDLAYAENARAELRSDNPLVLDPVIVNDTLRTVNQPVIAFTPKLNVNGTQIAGWDLQASQPTLAVFQKKGPGQPITRILWNTNEIYKNVPRDSSNISYKLQLTDTSGSAWQAAGILPVEMLTIEKKRVLREGNLEVNYYRLNMFDFNSAEASEAQKRITRLYIQKDIKPKSRIEIIGKTDSKGDAQSNKNLSEKRAGSVRNLFTSQNVSVKGQGEDSPLYNNGTPEGRMYNRSVEIKVINAAE
jgi:outer membrane protein OmpA-like peptidoglycan-associated protein